MSDSLRIWLIVLVFVLLGIVAKSIASYSYKTELVLDKGAIQNIQLFRLAPGHVSISLHFKHKNSTTLGNQKYIKNNGYIEYINLGEPIKLLVKDTFKSVLYEAKPASSGTERSMVPFIEDKDPSRFPGTYTESFFVGSGFSEFQIIVSEIGKNIEGTKVILRISPPMPGWKFISNNSLYALLWYLNFWPLLFLVLFFSYKYIKKTIPTTPDNKSNFVHILDHSVYHIVLIPALSFFIMLFLSHAAPPLAFLSIIIIHFITVPLFLQKKYPLYNNFQKSFSWFTWITSAIFIYFFLLEGFYKYII